MHGARNHLSELGASPTFAATDRDGRLIMEFARQTIDVNGCKLSLARSGKGVPLIICMAPMG
jgi:hypothetical protein